MYRAVVPIQNVDAFYQAFGIKKGDAMYVDPEKRVKIW
jgi:endothelin-converting enzyme/putative endopeptidase